MKLVAHDSLISHFVNKVAFIHLSVAIHGDCLSSEPRNGVRHVLIECLLLFTTVTLCPVYYCYTMVLMVLIYITVMPTILKTCLAMVGAGRLNRGDVILSYLEIQIKREKAIQGYF